MCPHCGRLFAIKRGKDPKGRQRYYCKWCQHYFVDRRGEELTPREREALLRSFSVLIVPDGIRDSAALQRARTKIFEPAMSLGRPRLSDLADEIARKLNVPRDVVASVLLEALRRRGEERLKKFRKSLEMAAKEAEYRNFERSVEG